MQATKNDAPHCDVDGPAGYRARPRWNPRRITSVVVGAVLTLCSLGMLGVGGAAVSVVTGDGYVNLGAGGSYRTDGYALTSDSTDWRTEMFGLVDTVRFEAASTNGTKPVFIGIAAPAEVQRYLAGVRHTTVHRNTGDGNTRTEHGGHAPENPPAAAIDWTAHTSGTGGQTLRWNGDAGEQRMVVMNADGSPSVGGHVVSSAVTVSGLPWIATGLLAGGVALLAAAIMLIVLPVRRARRDCVRNSIASA